MSDPPERIWAFYAPEIEEDNPGCTIVAGEGPMHGAAPYIRDVLLAEDAGDDYRLSNTPRRVWAERALAAEEKLKCPLDLDATPELCSAGTCPKCLSERALKAEAENTALRKTINDANKAYAEATRSAIKMATKKLEAERDRLREATLDAGASLVAAVSLLERGGKKAAPSDKMFEQMIADYKASISRARAALKGET